MTLSIQQRKDQLIHKTFTMMFKVLIIFGIPAGMGYFLGRYLDNQYQIRPFGTIGVLAVTFIFSWFLVIRMYLKINREFQKLREEEEELIQQRQEDQKI
ncbi:AtpZ/AtpI family protein [Candidatus Nomurabacteria bacterium]|nr:AtpZ/AtpI family protein [Candidatus Nomurabacteria bacterium]